MTRRRLCGLVVLLALVPSAPASAHNVTATITPPAGAVVEDTSFVMRFAGDVSSLPRGAGKVRFKIRRGVSVPCAPTEPQDPGDYLDFNFVDNAFGFETKHAADDPGDYRVCAWVLDDDGASGRPPRQRLPCARRCCGSPPALPRSWREGVPFTVTVQYELEAARRSSVLVARAPRCAINWRALFYSGALVVAAVDNVVVTGAGSMTATIRLDQPGTYLVCGFLDESVIPSGASPLAVHAATVTVPGPSVTSKSCGNIGGRRRIRGVSARNLSCAEARNVARRWGRQRRAARRVGAYRCFWRSGVVTCAAGNKRVQFGFGRR